ncbi:MAG: NUDIX domain-containing protein [Flavobacteriales bacterium]|nr:NUDIX domain-containing protein [Flavobacteriales bacterium]
MYKVFVKDKLLYLTSNPNFEASLQKNTLFLKYTSSSDFKIGINLLEHDVPLAALVVYHQEINFLLQELFKAYKVIHAAGGLVVNSQGKVLMIYRLKKWDLPKGKMEKSETPEEAAVREVQEETGISGLTVMEKLPDSFYFYEPSKGERVLKHIYWYKMHCERVEKLVPQTEEGISDVKWMDKTELSEAIKNTFPSVKDLLLSI